MPNIMIKQFSYSLYIQLNFFIGIVQKRMKGSCLILLQQIPTFFVFFTASPDKKMI
jgi:hypothetical protein